MIDISPLLLWINEHVACLFVETSVTLTLSMTYNSISTNGWIATWKNHGFNSKPIDSQLHAPPSAKFPTIKQQVTFRRQPGNSPARQASATPHPLAPWFLLPLGSLRYFPHLPRDMLTFAVLRYRPRVVARTLGYHPHHSPIYARCPSLPEMTSTLFHHRLPWY